MIYNAYQDTDEGIAGVSVVSCGHIFAQKGRKIDRPAGRSDFLLFYVVKGKEQFFVDGDAIAKSGSFVLFRPFEKQKHIYVDDKQGEFYFVHFNAPADFDLFGFKSSFIYNSKPSATVCSIFEEIIEELQKKQPAYEMLCSSMLFTLFSILVRKTKKESSPYCMYFDKISFIIQNMNKEYQINYTLEDYAKMCCMSKFHFIRVFKNITGKTPIEYRNSIRIEQAKELLTNTSKSIEEIGTMVGYSSNQYFCDAFKACIGISPTGYRKNNR